MAHGMNWIGNAFIANAFKIFDALIHPRRPAIDRSAEPASRETAVEAPAVSPPISVPHLEPAPEIDALPIQDALPIPDEGAIEAPPSQQADALPVEEDAESRRQLIRQLFNEYWTGIEDKPPTFAERLDVAENYINGRLAARDVVWRLDAATRKELGLPSSSTRS